MATTTDPLQAIPTWVFVVGLGVAAWMTYDAISPMVTARSSRRLAAKPAKRRAPGYFVQFDDDPDPDTGHRSKKVRHFATREDAKDFIRTKLSPRRRPEIIPE